MGTVRPIFGRLLIVAIVLYIISTTLILADICYRIGNIEHAMIHSGTGHVCQK